MKKLMTVLASAATALCAVGAWADFTETSTDFEGLTAGQAFDSNNGMDSHWVGASDAELFISNHTDTISVSRPDYVGRDDNANENYLAVENSVTRGLNTVAGGDFAGVAIPDNGIYLDTLVKFTAADEVFGEGALASGDKIAIEYVAQGDDVDDPITNFVIRAGYIGTEVTAKNYFAAVPEKMLMVYAMIFGAHLMPFSWLYDSKSYLVFSIVIPILALVVGMLYPPSVLAVLMVVIEAVFAYCLFMECKAIDK